MSEHSETQVFVVGRGGVAPQFPTHLHGPQFWEELGRTIATFGFLEEILAKGVFSFTVTCKFREDEIEAAYANWAPILEEALSGQLSKLIGLYDKAVCDHPRATIKNFNELITALREANRCRNVLCHGSWRKPDHLGRSVPFFVNRKKEVFETAIDLESLRQFGHHVVDFIFGIMNTITQMSWQFPGSSGPGKPIWP